MAIRLVVDTSAGITREYAQQNNIRIISIPCIVDGESYNEGLVFENDDLFEKIFSEKSHPSTSQPPQNAYYEVFSELLSQGHEIIMLTLSGTVSGAYNSACMVAQQLAPDKITVIDSKGATSMTKYLIEEIVLMINNGYDRSAIEAATLVTRSKLGGRFIPGSLSYLKRSGRVNTLQLIVGNILQIQLLIDVVNGTLTVMDRIRTKKRAIDTLISQIPKGIKRLDVIYTIAYDEAKQLWDILSQKFTDLTIEINEISPSVAVHVGPGVVGVMYCKS